MRSPIDSHPAKEQIIEGILARRPYRELAAIVGLSPMAISRYAKNVIAPGIKWARSIQLNERALKEPSSQRVTEIEQSVTPSVTRAVSKTVTTVTREDKQAAMLAANAAPIVERLRKRESRREEWIAGAECEENYRALVGFDANELRDIEVEARLLGLLDGNSATNVTINNNVVLVPNLSDMPCIDVTPEREK